MSQAEARCILSVSITLPNSWCVLCSGKSTVGKLAAQALKYPFLDSDHIAQAHDGRTISEIFETDGEEGFRELESAVLQVTSRTSTCLACLCNPVANRRS
jgi:shikimate kinase